MEYLIEGLNEEEMKEVSGGGGCPYLEVCIWVCRAEFD